MIRHTLWAGWWALVLGMILALLLTVVRFGFPLLGEYRDTLATQLSQRFGVSVSIAQLQTRWNGPFPQFELREIEARTQASAGAQVAFRFDRLLLELNWLDSLLARAPIFQRVDASGLYIRWYQRDGRWLHLPGEGISGQGVDLSALTASLGVVLAQPQFQLSDSQLELIPEQGVPQRIDLSEVLFENAADEHQLSGEFTLALLGPDTRLRFAARLEGQVDAPSSLSLPFYLKVDHLGPELLTLTNAAIPLTTLDAEAQVWGRLNRFGLDSLRGRVGIAQARIELPNLEFDLVDSSSEFSLKPNSEGFEVQLRETRLGDAAGQLEFAPSQFELNRVTGDLKLSRIMLERLDLSLLDQLLSRYPLPESARSILDELSPKGEVNHIRFDLSDPRRGPFARANLQGVSLSSWRNSPAVENLSGQLELDAVSGHLNIDSRDVQLHFPTAYSNPLRYELAQGRVSWVVEPSRVKLSSSPIELIHRQFAANGTFSVDLPYDREQQAYLSLMIGLQGGQASAAALLTPDRLPGTEKLNSWLAGAIGEGRVLQSGLVIETPLRTLEGRAVPSVELYVASEGVDLDYQSAWPALEDADAFVHLRQGDMRIDLSRAGILDSKMGRSVAIKPNSQNGLKLWGRVEGELSRVNQLFRSPPLADTAGRALDDWMLAGQHDSLIQLDVSFDKSYTPKLNVVSQVQSARFSSQTQRVDLSDISGKLTYDLDGGLKASAVQAKFLGRPASIKIQRSESGATEIKFAGRWQTESLLDWGRIPLKSLVSGEIPLEGRLTLCPAQRCRSNLTLESNLQGTRVEGPRYLALAEDETSRLSVDLSLGAPMLAAVNYADRLQTAMELGDVVKAHFSLGSQSRARVPKTAGFKVDGEIDELELGELFSFIGTLNSSFSGDGGAGIPLDVDLSLAALSVGPLVVDRVRAVLSQLGAEMQLELSGPAVQGLIAWSKDQPSYRVALNRLHLRVPQVESTEVESPAIVSPEVESLYPERTSQAIFDAVPAVDFDVADLRWNQAKLGRWRASIRNYGGSIDASSIRGEMQDLELSGNASWGLGETELTQINLAYQGDNLGSTLASIDEVRLIETESFTGRLALAWEAAPWQVAGRYMFGNLKFNTGKGRLLETSGGSGLLRLFGILNFNSLTRRLQLDFRDLFASGVVFDSLNGDFLVQDGVARAISPMEMKGVSAGMLASGEIDLGGKTLDMQVNVTLPLVSNTPLAAVLLGAPQVAGALFLIDKLIGDKIEKATSIAYTLRGAWDSPELKLLNSAANKASQ